MKSEKRTLESLKVLKEQQIRLPRHILKYDTKPNHWVWLFMDTDENLAAFAARLVKLDMV